MFETFGKNEIRVTLVPSEYFDLPFPADGRIDVQHSV